MKTHIHTHTNTLPADWRSARDLFGQFMSKRRMLVTFTGCCFEGVYFISAYLCSLHTIAKCGISLVKCDQNFG